MIKINRQQNPVFTTYKDKVVEDSLKEDFHKKCYICEESTRHFEVDHFYPQTFYTHLVDNYENLFYICQKCNKIKPKIINTHSENEILDCCEIDPSEYIKLRLNTKECKVEVTQIKDEGAINSKINETIKLLNRVYNGENSTSNSCEDLKDDIKDKLEEFRKKLDKYEKTRLKQALLDEIKNEIDIQSSYVTFKRWIIRDNSELNKKFGQFI